MHGQRQRVKMENAQKLCGALRSERARSFCAKSFLLHILTLATHEGGAQDEAREILAQTRERNSDTFSPMTNCMHVDTLAKKLIQLSSRAFCHSCSTPPLDYAAERRPNLPGHLCEGGRSPQSGFTTLSSEPFSRPCHGGGGLARWPARPTHPFPSITRA